MPHFGIAHLPVRQTHVQTGRADGGMAVDRRLKHRGRALGRRIGAGAGARFGVVGPPVAVEVLVRIVDAAVRPDVAGVGLLTVVLRLPDVGDLVVVGEELAEIEVADLAEVVDARAVGLRVARIEGVELEDLADQVLRVVGEPVSVEVGVALVALERVPPGVEVDDVVVVGVDVVGVGREVTAVVLQQVGEPLAVEVAVAVRVVPRREPDQLVGEVGDRADDAVPHAVGLEHHVELPAVGDAIAHAAVDRVGVVDGGA